MPPPLARFCIAILILSGAVPAPAAVTIHFLSRDFGESYPHAYVAFSGATDAEPGVAVDGNYGFTAVSASPAVLMGSVAGEVMSVNAVYRRKSREHFAVLLDDARYRQVRALIDQWAQLPGKFYNLNRRNCVHFVAAVARTIGLAAPDVPGLMKKPRSFLEKVTADNPSVTLPGGAAPPPAGTRAARPPA